MNKLPADLNLSPLIKQKLIQVCLGEFDLQFHFDGGWSISGGGNVEIEINESRANVFLDGRLNETSYLGKLIGASVTNWRSSPPRSFEVEFGDIAKLHFVRSDNGYEDFVIMPEGWIIS